MPHPYSPSGSEDMLSPTLRAAGARRIPRAGDPRAHRGGVLPRSVKEDKRSGVFFCKDVPFHVEQNVPFKGRKDARGETVRVPEEPKVAASFKPAEGTFFQVFFSVAYDDAAHF